jgi:hypothetical protein
MDRHGVGMVSSGGRQYDVHRNEWIRARIEFDPRSHAFLADGTATEQGTVRREDA